VRILARSLALALIGLPAYTLLLSDALVITRAMLASTIAEIFIEEDSVVVELEIGTQDLQAFRNLLPDQLYERMGYEPEPWIDRLQRFVAEDFLVSDERGRPLFGYLREIEPRDRIKRDEVTGEPLPVEPGEAEPVVFARVVYPTAGRPAKLSFSPPGSTRGATTANVGFVTYHHTLPINDFRYLGVEETLRLDWEDPWFSEFENRNLRRQFFAPISAFLYVEPYEVRKEIVLRPKDLQQWVDLGLAGMDTIRAEEQEELKRQVVEFLRDRNPLTIDGVPVEGYVDRVHFIYRNLRTSGVIDPPQDLDIITATLGVIFTYPVDGLPDSVEMKWELFNERIPVVPSSATDEAGSLPYIMSPGDDVLRWQNFLTNPTLPTLVEVAPPPRYRWAYWMGAAVGLVGLVVLVMRHWRDVMQRRWPAPRTWAAVAACFVLMALGLPRALGLGMASGQGEEVMDGLLRNVYLAFDYRDEGQIYDMLERSVTGDLLTDIYLETRRSLELANQGGARAKVKEVEILEGEFRSVEGGSGFETRLVWNVMGSVGHWGHIHRRTNQYEARFVVRADNGVWKIADMELLQEQRL
jgi:hypothetical protein